MAVAVEFRTIPELFQRLTGKFASESRPALMYKSEGTYKGITYSELRSKVETFAFGLAALGVERGDRVAIVSENRPEWVMSDQAIVALGAVGVPLYPTMTSKQIEYIFNDAGVKVAIVSNQFQLNKVMRVYADITSLEKVILIAEKGPIPEPDTFGFGAVLEMGEKRRKEDPDLVARSIQTVQPEDLLTLIYTSGTTGNPKGVMLTHHNMVTNVIASAEVIDFGTSDVMLSFLPLSHSFERMAGYYTAFACGATIAYAESVETVRDNMLEVRPTIVTTVPRLFERIYSRVMKQVDAGSPVRRKIFMWGLAVGRLHARARRKGSIPIALRLKHAVANKLVYAKLNGLAEDEVLSSRRRCLGKSSESSSRQWDP
jgi:long-chain acyl-CoA synthetase